MPRPFPSPNPPKRPGSPGAWLITEGGIGVAGVLPQRLQRPPDEAGDVHLRDPDTLGDLRLREPLLEAQVEDDPLAGRQVGEAGVDGRAGLRRGVALLVDAHRDAHVLLRVAAARR